MFKYLAIFILLFSTISLAQAECKDIDASCAVVFKSIPDINPVTTTSSCDGPPLQYTYVVENEAPVPAKLIEVELAINDAFPATAVSIDLASTCKVGLVLQPGATCTVIIDFEVCTSGEINRTLIVQAEGQKPLESPIETTVFTQMAYIADDGVYNDNGEGDKITICDVKGSDGTLYDCYNHQDDTFDYPIDVILNANNTTAYIANAKNSNTEPYDLSVCTVDPSTGALGTCRIFTDDSFVLEYTGLRLSPNEKFLYLTDSNLPIGSDSVSICTVQDDGYLTYPCDIYEDEDIVQPNGRIVFNSLGSPGTIAYIPSFKEGLGSSFVTICSVDPDTGEISNCNENYGDNNVFNDLQGLDISPDGQYLYAANNYYMDTVAKCKISSDGLSLSECSQGYGNDSDGNKTFYFDTNSTNIFTNNRLLNYAYIPNGCVKGTGYPLCTPTEPSNVSICPIDTTQIGGFGPCTVTTANDLLITADSVWIANFPYTP